MPRLPDGSEQFHADDPLPTKERCLTKAFTSHTKSSHITASSRWGGLWRLAWHLQDWLLAPLLESATHFNKIAANTGVARQEWIAWRSNTLVLRPNTWLVILKSFFRSRRNAKQTKTIAWLMPAARRPGQSYGTNEWWIDRRRLSGQPRDWNQSLNCRIFFDFNPISVPVEDKIPKGKEPSCLETW